MSDRVLETLASADADGLRAALAAEPAAADARDATGVSALLLARYRGRLDLVELLLEAGAEPDVFAAAGIGATARLRELLDAQPELANAWSGDGFTPLHLAAFFGHAEGVDVLLERGADIHSAARNEMRVQPLHSAAAADELEIAERLIARGADVNAVQEGGFTPLHAAAQNGNVQLVRLLLEHGADVEATTADGRRAHDFAQEAGHEEAAALLLERLGA